MRPCPIHGCEMYVAFSLDQGGVFPTLKNPTFPDFIMKRIGDFLI